MACTRFSRRNRTSSARSWLVKPSRWLASTSPLVIQFRRQDSLIPGSFAIAAIRLSPRRANSTARRRNSGGCCRHSGLLPKMKIIISAQVSGIGGHGPRLHPSIPKSPFGLDDGCSGMLTSAMAPSVQPREWSAA